MTRSAALANFARRHLALLWGPRELSSRALNGARDLRRACPHTEPSGAAGTRPTPARPSSSKPDIETISGRSAMAVGRQKATQLRRLRSLARISVVGG